MSIRYKAIGDSTTEYKPSNLQQIILRLVCTNKDTDYHSLLKATGKTRTTIVQSLQSLRARHYINAYKTHPDISKSSLIFKPSHKGMYYALAYLGAEYDEILSVNVDAAKITNYNRRVSEVKDPQLRRTLMYFFAKMIYDDNYFNDDGTIKSAEPEDIINIGFRIALRESIEDKSFDFRKLFSLKNTKFLKKVYTKEELQLVRNVLTKIRNNLDSCVKQLHD